MQDPEAHKQAPTRCAMLPYVLNTVVRESCFPPYANEPTRSRSLSTSGFHPGHLLVKTLAPDIS